MQLSNNTSSKKQLQKQVEQGRAFNRTSELKEQYKKKRQEYCYYHQQDQFRALGYDQTNYAQDRAQAYDQSDTPQYSIQDQDLDLNFIDNTSKTLFNSFFVSNENPNQIYTTDFFAQEIDSRLPPPLQMYEPQEKKKSNMIDFNKLAQIQGLTKIPPLIQSIPPPIRTPAQKDNYFGLNRANTSLKKTITQNSQGMIEIKEYVFHKQNVIGCGSFSKVYRGFKIRDHSQLVAIKEIKISNVGERKLMQEIQIHQVMEHSQYIVQLFDYLIDKPHDTCYLVLEYCPQGSLDNQFRLLNKQKSLSFFNQLLQAMKDLNDNNIIHRDLKLENILIKNNQIKLADFGFARPLPENTLSVMSQKCGTPATMAPELLFCDQNKVIYSDKQDVWSLGVILHELIYKEHPFAQNRDRMRYNTNYTYIRMNQRIYVNQKDPIVESFLQQSLQFDSQLRMSLKECLDHEITRTYPKIQKSPQSIQHPKRLKLYNDSLDVKPRRLAFEKEPHKIQQPTKITNFMSTIQPFDFKPVIIKHSWIYEFFTYILGILLMLSKKTFKL